jgi:RNA polymerase sigma factor (TIGR02999 family)
VPGELTQWLASLERGDRTAIDHVFAIVYGELKRLAHAQRVRASGGTLGTTALVHETYLKLVRADAVSAQSREHFYRLASRAMRQVLLDGARIAQAAKRPAPGARVTLDGDGLELASESWSPEHTLDLDAALAALEAMDARLAEVAELHLFAGLEFAEIAALRGVSERTVLRDWRKARAVLAARLGEAPA